MLCTAMCTIKVSRLSPACVGACYFVLTALKSYGNLDVRNDLVEFKIKRHLPVS